MSPSSGTTSNRLPFAIRLGRLSRQIIVQNLVIALGVIGLLMLSSVLGWTSIGAAVVLHESSTVAGSAQLAPPAQFAE